jgi:hypothetical protein
MLCGQQETLERLSNWMGVCNSLVKNLDDLIMPATFDLLDTYFMYSPEKLWQCQQVVEAWTGQFYT